MKIEQIEREEALGFLLNPDYMGKVGYASKEEAISYLDKTGYYLGTYKDGELIAIAQWALKDIGQVSLHGYVSQGHRSIAIPFYKKIMEIMDKAGFEKQFIYCDKQVKNFTTKRLGFVVEQSIDDKYFLVSYTKLGKLKS